MRGARPHPCFGRIRLLDLRPKHIDDWVTAQLKANRGLVTVYRAVSTLRNALNAAVRSWRLRYNPAKHSVPPKPRAAERTCWTPEQAATFLRHGAEQYADRLTDLFEVMLGTGMRRGEVLALHWSDVHLMDRKLYVRWTLAAIDNGKTHLREPKTEAGRAWISLSPRVMAALHRQAAIQMAAHPDARLEGLVFDRPGGTPLRPQWVLDQLRKRTAGLDLPRIGLHDLRHTAASIMIAENIPIAVISKTLRHSTIATHDQPLRPPLQGLRRPGCSRTGKGPRPRRIGRHPAAQGGPGWLRATGTRRLLRRFSRGPQSHRPQQCDHLRAGGLGLPSGPQAAMSVGQWRKPRWGSRASTLSNGSNQAAGRRSPMPSCRLTSPSGSSMPSNRGL
ncbi:site-specific integrase [Kitasatospora aureofaciens]|uniref:tyrosine-type recombinase/integrase n=1 Tax=Kitasatospora aureofaciens TaxID=1894 RepID=UPI001C48B0E6|nr:site-specific integrase [Kitasatospora aureofaciens]MBV6703079.1 site-specific integrase [Kitasatospora aureofaciens]